MSDLGFPLGPFDVADAHALQVDVVGSHYAGRIIDHGGPKLVSWLRTGPDGEFIGELSDPVPVVANDGRLELDSGA